MDARRASAAAGTNLFSAGDEGDGLYLVETGLMKAMMRSPDGVELIVSIFGPGDIVGEVAVIDGLPRSTSVVVMRDSTYRFVSKEMFEEFTSANPEFHRELVMVLSMRLREADDALAASAFLPSKGRVARALLDLLERAGEPSDRGAVMLNHRIGIADLAAMAGIARENVSRILNDWRDRNLVVRSGPFLCVPDIAALEREIQ